MPTIKRAASTTLHGTPVIVSPALLVSVSLLLPLLGVKNGDMAGAVKLPLTLLIPLTPLLGVMVDDLAAEFMPVDPPAPDMAPYTAADVWVELRAEVSA